MPEVKTSRVTEITTTHHATFNHADVLALLRTAAGPGFEKAEIFDIELEYDNQIVSLALRSRTVKYEEE